MHVGDHRVGGDRNDDARPKKGFAKTERPGIAPGPLVSCRWSVDQKSIPPPGGIAGAADFFFGTSATIASVVISRPATDAAPCSA